MTAVRSRRSRAVYDNSEYDIMRDFHDGVSLCKGQWFQLVNPRHDSWQRHVTIRDHRSSIQKCKKEGKYSRKNSRLPWSCCCVIHLKAYQWIKSHSFMRQWQFRSLRGTPTSSGQRPSLVLWSHTRTWKKPSQYIHLSIGFQTIFAFIYTIVERSTNYF